MILSKLRKRKNLETYLFTSESVSAGHPDKVADQISDAILDAYLENDSQARVAIETMVAPHNVVVSGEVTAHHKLSNDEIVSVIRKTIKKIGYNKEPFNYKTVNILNFLHRQSPDIAQGVLQKEEGAGDQGLMFGYACNETDEYMPATIHYAHKLMRTLMDATKNGKLKGMGPDAKCQVTLHYDMHHKPYKADSIVVSIQHPNSYSQEKVKSLIRPFVLEVFPKGWMCKEENFYVNPTGKFTIGGPQSDAGVTGRKIIVDTYGGAAPHGGGAFSGKDPSKVDRSAAYAARYLAKNIVASGLATKCLIQISYAIGIAKPLAIYINTFGTSKIHENRILSMIPKLMDLTPRGIRNHLNLDRPIYSMTAAYGHFGRQATEDGWFPWEKLDLVEKIKNLTK